MIITWAFFGLILFTACEKPDCIKLGLNKGDICPLIDGTLGIINDNCECEKAVQKEYDCPELKLNFGDACMSDSTTLGHIGLDCVCKEKEPKYDCPELMLNIGDICDSTLTGGFPKKVNKDCECGWQIK
jgi:hypothetical protein